MIRVLNLLQPLVDHLYIYQLMEYHSWDLLKWFFKYPFKRHLQKKQQISFTSHILALLIISLSLILGLSYILSAGFSSFLLFVIIFLQISPIFIIASEMLFKPLESYQKYRIIQKAIAKRKTLDKLKVIAIVGSYAKTSTKNMLYTLIWKDIHVVKTPKSYNTELSIARCLLSDLKENTEVFICEMDAYSKGEITTLCEIAQPAEGIITAIGPQHLSRFGSMESLAKTQFELAEYLGNKTLFLNDQDEWSKKLSHHLKNEIIWFQNDKNFISNYRQSDNYASFRLHLGREYADIKLPVKGEHNAVNFLASAVIAHYLGISIKTIRQRAELIRPTEHRLQVREMGNTTILDNTYNANPQAALASLALLRSFGNKIKVVVTPGFVELGDDHVSAHREFGREIAKTANEVIIVGENAKKALNEGLELEKFPPEHIHFLENTQKALAHLSYLYPEEEKVVLLENDLPDQYF